MNVESSESVECNTSRVTLLCRCGVVEGNWVGEGTRQGCGDGLCTGRREDGDLIWWERLVSEMTV